jgi:phage tail tape-measure protein
MGATVGGAALAGVETGELLGTIGGPVGMAIGAGVGATLGAAIGGIGYLFGQSSANPPPAEYSASYLHHHRRARDQLAQQTLESHSQNYWSHHQRRQALLESGHSKQVAEALNAGAK